MTLLVALLLLWTEMSFHSAEGAAFHTTTRVNGAPFFAVGVVVMLPIERVLVLPFAPRFS